MAEPTPLVLPPGLVRGRRTDYATVGRYSDGAHMRWVTDGGVVAVKPMKGWDVALESQLEASARGAHAWVDNEELQIFHAGSYEKLYAYDNGTFSDVTPSGFTVGSEHVGTWTMDNMGEIGISCFDADGRINEYQPGAGGIATVVTNSPTAKAAFVTDEKFLIALAINGDPRAFAWCSQDSRTVWTPTALNTAGDLPINEVGALMCGAKIKGGGLLWTTTGLYFLEFVGRPDVYGNDRVGNNCGIISRNAKCVFGSSAYWMGKKKFYSFTGYTKPLECDIEDYVFGNINEAYAHKVWAHHRPQHSEVWFAYPHGDETECSHAAIYNYEKGYWNHTPFARGAGFDDEVFGYPVAISAEGLVFNQETEFDYDETVYLMADDETTFLTADDGTTDLVADPEATVGVDGGIILPYLQSGPVEIGAGDRRMQLDEFWPDEENQGSVETYFNLREFPNSTEYTIGPFTSADRVGVFSTARMASVKYKAVSPVEDFRIGIWRAKMGPRRGRT